MKENLPSIFIVLLSKNSFMKCQRCDRMSMYFTGCNTVIKNFPLKPGDAMLINSLTYPAVANTAHHTAATRGMSV